MPLNWTKADLFTVTKAYADRYDAEVNDNLDFMLGLAEDRMSRIMRNREMSAEYSISAVDGQGTYNLPVDFAGMRDIQLKDGVTFHYLNPEQLNNISLIYANLIYYTIVGNTLKINPVIGVKDGEQLFIDIIYYQRVPPLTDNTDSNWILAHHADIYKAAMSAEVEVFVKNDQRAGAFWTQLDGMFAEIENRDWQDRWSGTSLATRLETNRGH